MFRVLDTWRYFADKLHTLFFQPSCHKRGLDEAANAEKADFVETKKG